MMMQQSKPKDLDPRRQRKKIAAGAPLGRHSFHRITHKNPSKPKPDF